MSQCRPRPPPPPLPLLPLPPPRDEPLVTAVCESPPRYVGAAEAAGALEVDEPEPRE